MVALLKQKAKITIQRKERTKYELADVFKKRKLEGETLADSQMQPQVSQTSSKSSMAPKPQEILRVADAFKKEETPEPNKK